MGQPGKSREHCEQCIYNCKHNEQPWHIEDFQDDEGNDVCYHLHASDKEECALLSLGHDAPFSCVAAARCAVVARYAMPYIVAWATARSMSFW